MELEMDCLTSRKLLQKVCSYKCQFCTATNVSSVLQSMCIFKALKSSSYDCWVIYKEKVPGMSDPNQNVKTTYNSKLKFT